MTRYLIRRAMFFLIALACNLIAVFVSAWIVGATLDIELTLWQSAVVLLFLWASAGHARDLRRRR